MSLLLVALALAAGGAPDDDDDASMSPPIAVAHATSASHVGTLERGANGAGLIVWRSEIAVDGAGRLLLRRPLPRDVEASAVGARVVRDAGGDVVALDVSRDKRRVNVTVSQPRREALAPPLVPAVERVAFDDGNVIDVASGYDIDRHIGYSTAADVAASDRRAISRGYGDLPPSAAPVYLGRGTTQLLVERGLVGALHRSNDDKARAAAGALAMFVVCAGGLSLLVKGLARRAALERAERVLDAEWRDLAASAAPDAPAPGTRR